MKIAVLLLRILLGLEFFVFGLNGLFHFLPQPPMAPSPGATFATLLTTSHYIVVVALLEAIGGLLLLVGRFVPLGLTVLGPIIVNILLFHILLLPQGLPIAIVTALFWLALFWFYRSYFSGIFTANATPAI